MTENNKSMPEDYPGRQAERENRGHCPQNKTVAVTMRMEA
jgi:hypothetical protein